MTERRDPDFICAWCVKRADGKLQDNISPAEIHNAICRYCCAYTDVRERSAYAFPPGQEPRLSVPGSRALSGPVPSFASKQICWSCIKRAKGVRRSGGYWLNQATCAFCGKPRRTVDVQNYNFPQLPEVTAKPPKQEEWR
jgi:hypothetical protein